MIYTIPNILIEGVSIENIIKSCITCFCNLDSLHYDFKHKEDSYDIPLISFYHLKRCISESTFDRNFSNYRHYALDWDLFSMVVNRGARYPYGTSVEFQGYKTRVQYVTDDESKTYLLTSEKDYHLRNIIKNLQSLPQNRLGVLIQKGLVMRFNSIDELIIELQLKGVI